MKNLMDSFQNSPIIFCHYGLSGYLRYTLLSAKISNPNKKIVLLGDETNRLVAQELNISHVLFKKYDSSVSVVEFNKTFQFIAGSNHGRFEWTKFVFLRWFYVLEFLQENGFNSFWHFDSDNLILVDLSSKEECLKSFDNTEQCGGICINGFISSRSIIQLFTGHIIMLFGNQEFLSKQQKKCSINPNFAFTEMAAYNDFKKQYNLKTVRLNSILSDEMFDDCLAFEDNMSQSSEFYNGYKIKRVYLNHHYELYFKHSSDNKFYKVNSINFSWMPNFVIIRLFYTFCRSRISIFRIFNFRKNFVEINYKKYSFFDKMIDRFIFCYLKTTL